MGNCDVWGYVDFGNGTVRIRCTLTGVHEKHVCVVQIVPEETVPNEEPVARHNIFEG